jgi:surfeit locus 1 family protein
MTLLPRLRWIDVPFLVLIGAVAACCSWLGAWQLQRYQTRVQDNARIAARLQQDAVQFDSLLPLNGLDEYRRVTVQGEFLPDQRAFFGNREYQGLSGTHLLAAFKPTDSQDVLVVDLGWVPMAVGVVVEPSQYLPGGVQTLTGVLMPSRQLPVWLAALQSQPTADRPNATWRTVDVDAIAAVWQYKVQPLYLEVRPLEQPSQPSGTGNQKTLPYFQSEIELSTGSHLGYAVQWFAFAIIAVAGGWFLLQRANITPDKV